MDSKLNIFLDQSEFAQAGFLLKNHLAKAEIINPKIEETWRDYADLIGFKLREAKGDDASIAFWEDLLCFFEEQLEPKWGHLHKGRIFFRLGVFNLFRDISRGKEFLVQALEESRLQEKENGTQDIEKAIQKFSSYVALCIVEQINDIQAQGEDLGSESDQQNFFGILFTAFDSVIRGNQIETEIVKRCVEIIVPSQGIEQTLESLNELNRAYNQHFKIAIISLTGIFIENILLSILRDKHNIKQIDRGKRQVNINETTPHELIQVARSNSVFPSDPVKVAFQLIHFFRNRGHPGIEMNKKYKLTERIAKTIKSLADHAVVSWAS